jgi:osmotically inducible protein OsmC
VLAAALVVTIAGIDQQTAERLVQGAHTICPYSNAIRGNVDVAISVSVRRARPIDFMPPRREKPRV